MPRESDKIDVRNSDFYVGTPTFAMKRGERVPFLMYQLGAYEKSIEEIIDIFGSYLHDDSLGQGYVYNPSGLTYGDMNSLMGNWDGFYSFYEFNNNLSMLSSEVIFNIFDNEGNALTSPVLYEQTYDNGSWGVRESPRQSIMGQDQLRPNPWGYGMSVVRDAEVTKRASVGMIIGQGDPSSPPSDIFMSETKMGQHSYETTCECGTKAIWDGSYKNPIEVEQIDWPSPSFDHFEMQLTMKCPNPECDEYHYCIIEEDYLSKPKFSAESFAAEDPTQADASDLGGPTTPGNAGVPADVGGDDLVPYDSPSAPPAGVFMNAESNVYETKPFKNAMLGIAFTISALTFWSTAGTAVKTYVVSVVDTYAPKLLEPQNKIIITTLALVGIVYFGNRLRSENQPLTIPRMIDLTEASVTGV